eukprot:4982424-Pyramimonas_sp.AAC.1
MHMRGTTAPPPPTGPAASKPPPKPPPTQLASTPEPSIPAKPPPGPVNDCEHPESCIRYYGKQHGS